MQNIEWHIELASTETAGLEIATNLLSFKTGKKHKETTATFLYAVCDPLTDLHDPSKNRSVVHSAAVPPPMSELVLALLDACLGSVSNVAHVVLVQLAQLSLALQTAQQQQQRRD